MTKKYFGRLAVGFLFITMILAVSLNLMAYQEGETQAPVFATDKSERTLIKEVLVNQGEMLALLREIKAMLQAAE